MVDEIDEPGVWSRHSLDSGFTNYESQVLMLRKGHFTRAAPGDSLTSGRGGARVARTRADPSKVDIAGLCSRVCLAKFRS